MDLVDRLSDSAFKQCNISLIPRLSPHPNENKNRGGEPGIDSHVISWHNNVTALITKVVTQLCSQVIG